MLAIAMAVIAVTAHAFGIAAHGASAHASVSAHPAVAAHPAAVESAHAVPAAEHVSSARVSPAVIRPVAISVGHVVAAKPASGASAAKAK